jgi:hypothetical protein
MAITGHTFHDLLGTHDQQDMDLDNDRVREVV